jgi:hypothetical protein
VRGRCDRPARIVAHGREATAAYLTIIEGQSERHKAHKLKGAHSLPPPSPTATPIADMSPTHFAVTKRKGAHR